MAAAQQITRQNTMLKPGYRLQRKKGTVWHLGTYLGAGRVAHFSPDGLCIDSITNFANGKDVYYQATPVAAALLRQRLAEAEMHYTSYNPLLRNCEHLAHFLQTGKQHSPQAKGAVAGLAIGTGIALTQDMKPLTKAAVMLLCTWAGARLMRPSGSLLDD